MFSITTLTANAQSPYNIKVAKTLLNDFTVTNGASYIGSSFDTTYRLQVRRQTLLRVGMH